MRDFRELRVWERAHELTLAVYSATSAFPRIETYGLTAQMRRASISIPANLAEGCGKSGEREFRRYLLIAMGSASELEYELLLARDLHYLEDPVHAELSQQLVEVRKMLNTLIQRIKPSNRP